MAVSSVAASTADQFAARQLVRDWASGSAVSEAARAVERGEADGWRMAYLGAAELGLFGVAVPEEHGGAGGTVADLCAMVDEAAAAMVPGPVATTALTALVLGESHARLLEALASGERCRWRSSKSPWRRPGCWRRTGRDRTAAKPVRPNSC